VSFGEKRKQLFAGGEKRGWYPEIEIILLQFCRYFCYRNPMTRKKNAKIRRKRKLPGGNLTFVKKWEIRRIFCKGLAISCNRGKHVLQCEMCGFEQ
jgi:hypothetical protein